MSWKIGVCVLTMLAGGPFANAQDFGLDLTEDVEAPSAKVQVTLTSDVSGAVLFIDGKQIGELPQGPQKVSAGNHEVTVKRPGYAPFTQQVKVGKKGTVNVEASLEPVSEVVTINSDPDGADVFIDNKGSGKAPVVVELPPGRHDLRVVKDTYQDWTYTIFTRPGRESTYTATLQLLADRPVQAALTPQDTDADMTANVQETRSPPMYKRWYVWAGAAAVVAIATGVAVAVSSSQHSGPGPIDSTQVCGGSCDIVMNHP